MDMLAVHKMKPKEKIETLSAYYKVPVCMIMRANSINETGFYGKEIKIPKKCYCNRCAGEKNSGVFITYTAKAQDTFYSIARMHGITMNILLKTNGIDDLSSIKEGDILSIPVIKGELYTVRPHESIEDIAKRYNISADSIRNINCLDKSGKVYPGMRLILS